MLNWLDTWLGLGSANGAQYLWWSGFFADLPIPVAALVWYLHHQCAEHRCLRFAHHGVDGTHYKTCHKHATIENHAVLKLDHKLRHPRMHALFKDRDLNDSR